MATFEVPILRVDDVQEVPNSDFLTIVSIGGYKCIANKKEDGSWRYNKNDLVVYIPEGAIVPEWILRDGFWDEEKGKGILAGPNGDRVKAIKLRGVLSQGILRPVLKDEVGNVYIELSSDGNARTLVREGLNVAEQLGIVKYEPPIPVSMAGQVVNIGSENTLKFDVENIKRYMNVFSENDQVSVTEKLHGTCAIFGYIKNLNNHEITQGNLFSASKGLGSQGLVMKDVEANQGNLYLQAGKREVFDYLRSLRELFNNVDRVFILGEIFGKGVQDLSYGVNKPEFRAFDICIDNKYLTPVQFFDISEEIGMPTVPELYRGAYSFEKIDELSKGNTTLGNGHIREGVVIRCLNGNNDDIIGRKMLKHINPKYLTRKDGTEYS